MTTLPTRFRANEARGRRLGRVLRWFARVREVDEDLMEQVGRGFLEVDELGASLARAMRLPEGDPQRVTRAQFERALADGVAEVPDAPVALKAFFDTVETVPPWVDWERVERGAEVGRRLGQNAADVLLQLSLIGGYRFGGPTDLLVATGGLVGDSTLKRLAETEEWTNSVAQPGAMRHDGAGYAGTVHVRLMHALVNESFRSSWDLDQWGEPINQSDQAATLGLFSGILLIGARALGVRVTPQDSADVIHLWRYIGWLMGVDDKWLVDDERAQHVLNYHVVLAQGDITDAGPQLAQALVDSHRGLHFRRFAAIRRWAARERLLSMLTAELGLQSMRDLGLPPRLPWAPAYVFALNTVRYRIIGRTEAGRRYLLRWGDRAYARAHARHVGHGVGTTTFS